jgi:hypothetical protein
MTEPARAALAVLRSSANFDWPIVYMLALTVFIYSGEIMAQRWKVIAAGLAFWFADWINELVNSAILFWSGRAPLWVETGHTSYQILVGLNAETTLLFLLCGMVFAKLLPANPRAKILGLNSRWMLIGGQSILSVILEVVLNRWGYLNWYWPFWNVGAGLILIVIFGYAWFYAVAAWAHDAETETKRWSIVGGLASVSLLLAIVFGSAGWL